MHTNTHIITNGLDLGEDRQGKGRYFTSKFLEPGLAKYDAPIGTILLDKETIDKFIASFKGCPVIIDHKDITDDTAKDERVGVVSNVWYNADDGWYYCDGVIFDKNAQSLITNAGYTVSCAYSFNTDEMSGTWHNNPYDSKVVSGDFLHLALVPVPRYEDATIVLNSKNIVCNYIEPDNIGGWITTKNDIRIPLIKGKSKKESLQLFFSEKTKERLHKTKQKNEAIDILYDVVGKDLNYTKADLKRNIGKKNIVDKIESIIETNADRLTSITHKGDFFDTSDFNYEGTKYDDSHAQEDFLHNLLDGIVSGDFNSTGIEDKTQGYYDDLGKYLNKSVDSLIDEVVENPDYDIDEILTKLADIYGIEVENLDKNILKDFFEKTEKKQANNKINLDEPDARIEKDEDMKLNQLWQLFNKKEAMNKKGENEMAGKVDKRKLIDEIGGILKGKVDDELIRTIIKKAEEIGYEDSEKSADNKAKNEADEDNKDEDKKEEKAENKCAKNEDDDKDKDKKEADNEDEDKMEEMKKACNSMDKMRKAYNSSNVQIKSLYTPLSERVELGKQLF